jgi:hypothetical protein
VLFPLDARWIYYEREARLLNRPRPELGEHLDTNEFWSARLSHVVFPRAGRCLSTACLICICTIGALLDFPLSCGRMKVMEDSSSPSPRILYRLRIFRKAPGLL